MMASKKEFWWLHAISIGPFFFSIALLSIVMCLQKNRIANLDGYFKSLNNNVYDFNLIEDR
jgi:hypothetical protein